MSEIREPLGVYRQRLEDRTQRFVALGRRDGWYANGRLAVFVLGLGVVWLSTVEGIFPIATMGLPVLAFLALVFIHEGIVRTKSIAEGAVRYYQRGIDRIEDRWAGRGQSGEDLVPKNHRVP